MILQVHIDARTERWLRAAASDLGRSLEDLVESAVEEAALSYAKQARLPLRYPQDVAAGGNDGDGGGAGDGG